MAYTPTNIRRFGNRASFSISFTLNAEHEIRFQQDLTNYRLYVDGVEIPHSGMSSCRFKIEGVDGFFDPGILRRKLDVGGLDLL
jgi:hypothetical protein